MLKAFDVQVRGHAFYESELQRIRSGKERETCATTTNDLAELCSWISFEQILHWHFLD